MNKLLTFSQIPIKPELLTSGYVSNSLSNSDCINDIYSCLRGVEKTFLYEKKFIDFIPQSYKSKWPVEKVNWWSRPYEYTFILFKLHQLYEEGARNFLEFGPGCSIIPLYIANTFPDASLTLVDIDPAVHSFISHSFGDLDFKNYTLLYSLDGFDLSTVDVFYSVSVIEHLTRALSFLKSTVNELSPSASFVSTIDVDRSFRGKHGLTKHEMYSILNAGISKASFLEDYQPLGENMILSNSSGWLFEYSNINQPVRGIEKLKQHINHYRMPNLNVFKIHLRRI
jgi:hypothetical protein